MLRELLISGALAGCAAPDAAPESHLIEACRKMAGIDVAPILGKRFVDCGDYRISPFASGKPGSQSLSCVLRTQWEGRALIYQFEEIALPHVDYYELVVFGTQGERILVQYGSFGDEQVGFAGACEKLEVQDDGSVDHTGCSNTHPLMERLKIATPR
jgi:hypothetical protein